MYNCLVMIQGKWKYFEMHFEFYLAEIDVDEGKGITPWYVL